MRMTETIYRKHINQIRNLAWSFHRTTRIEYEELFDVACLSVVTNIHKYDAERGSLSNFIHRTVQSNLINFTNKERKYTKHLPITAELVLEVPDNKTATKLEFLDLIASLSEEAKQVYQIILEAPSEYLVESSKKSRGNLMRLLRKHGWSVPVIQRVFRELKSTLR